MGDVIFMAHNAGFVLFLLFHWETSSQTTTTARKYVAGGDFWPDGGEG